MNLISNCCLAEVECRNNDGNYCTECYIECDAIEEPKDSKAFYSWLAERDALKVEEGYYQHKEKAGNWNGEDTQGEEVAQHALDCNEGNGTPEDPIRVAYLLDFDGNVLAKLGETVDRKFAGNDELKPINNNMYKDLTTRSQRLGWFKSRFAPTWLDGVTYVVIIGVVSLMVANIALKI